jgi:hypothetical protein
VGTLLRRGDRLAVAQAIDSGRRDVAVIALRPSRRLHPGDRP